MLMVVMEIAFLMFSWNVSGDETQQAPRKQDEDIEDIKAQEKLMPLSDQVAIINLKFLLEKMQSAVASHHSNALLKALTQANSVLNDVGKVTQDYLKSADGKRMVKQEVCPYLNQLVVIASRSSHYIGEKKTDATQYLIYAVEGQARNQNRFFCMDDSSRLTNASTKGTSDSLIDNDWPFYLAVYRFSALNNTSTPTEAAGAFMALQSQNLDKIGSELPSFMKTPKGRRELKQFVCRPYALVMSRYSAVKDYAATDTASGYAFANQALAPLLSVGEAMFYNKMLSQYNTYCRLLD